MQPERNAYEAMMRACVSFFGAYFSIQSDVKHMMRTAEFVSILAQDGPPAPLTDAAQREVSLLHAAVRMVNEGVSHVRASYMCPFNNMKLLIVAEPWPTAVGTPPSLHNSACINQRVYLYNAVDATRVLHLIRTGRPLDDA